MLFIYVSSCSSFRGFLGKSESDDTFNKNKEKSARKSSTRFAFNFENEKTYTKWNFGATCMLLKHWRTNDVNKAKINFVRKFPVSPVIFHAFRSRGVTKGIQITSVGGNKLQFLVDLMGTVYQWWRSNLDFEKLKNRLWVFRLSWIQH